MKIEQDKKLNSIKTTAVNYLNMRARTCEELKRYLLRKGYEIDDIDSAITLLRSISYLDDVKYVSMYLRYAFSKNRGMQRIKRELHDKGVSSEDIEIGIEQFEEDEACEVSIIAYNTALELALKTVSDGVPDEKQLGRISRRLSSLGHSSSHVYKIIGILREKSSEE